MVKKGETEFTSLDAFKKGDYKVGTQTGTTNYDAAKKLYGAGRVQAFETFPFAVQALLNGDVDAVIIDDTAGQGYVGADKESLELLPGSITLPGARLHLPEGLGPRGAGQLRAEADGGGRLAEGHQRQVLLAGLRATGRRRVAPTRHGSPRHARLRPGVSRVRTPRGAQVQDRCSTGDGPVAAEPPMAERFRFNARDFPYWLVAILGILAWMVVLIRHERQVPRGLGRDHPGPHHHDQRHVLRLRLRRRDRAARRARAHLAERRRAQRRDHLHRVHPRRADPRAAVHGRVRRSSRSSRARSASRTRACRLPARGVRARDHLRRVPRRGVPRRHRVGAQGPDRGRPLARPEPRSDDAQDRAPAGGPQHDAGDRQRPDRDAQGLVAAVGARRSGRSPRKAGSTRARRSSSARRTWC